MTDNEIIKALECCINNGDCRECALNPKKGNYGYCTGLAIKSALDLINRQKAENSNLTSDLTSLRNDLTSAKAEIERLKAENKYYKELEQGRYVTGVKIIKSEAYKEFAERLKEKPTQYFYETNRDMTIPLVSFDRIDNLLKEMVGEDK